MGGRHKKVQTGQKQLDEEGEESNEVGLVLLCVAFSKAKEKGRNGPFALRFSFTFIIIVTVKKVKN